eukprot:3247491-Prorocentrum_lima.AAC.1
MMGKDGRSGMKTSLCAKLGMTTTTVTFTVCGNIKPPLSEDASHPVTFSPKRQGGGMAWSHS